MVQYNWSLHNFNARHFLKKIYFIETNGNKLFKIIDDDEMGRDKLNDNTKKDISKRWKSKKRKVDLIKRLPKNEKKLRLSWRWSL
jgi:hypothetical protein